VTQGQRLVLGVLGAVLGFTAVFGELAWLGGRRGVARDCWLVAAVSLVGVGVVWVRWWG
jgi:hypothetical protein